MDNKKVTWLTKYVNENPGCGFISKGYYFKEYGKYLSLEAKEVYCTLKTHFRPGKPIFPDINTIAEMSGISRNLAMRALHELEVFGWVEIMRKGKKKVNFYRLRIPLKDDKFTYDSNLNDYTGCSIEAGDFIYSPANKDAAKKFQKEAKDKRTKVILDFKEVPKEFFKLRDEIMKSQPTPEKEEPLENLWVWEDEGPPF